MTLKIAALLTVSVALTIANETALAQTSDGYTVTYDVRGRLNAITYQNAQVYTLNLDAAGNRVTQLDSANRDRKQQIIVAEGPVVNTDVVADRSAGVIRGAGILPTINAGGTPTPQKASTVARAGVSRANQSTTAVVASANAGYASNKEEGAKQ